MWSLLLSFIFDRLSEWSWSHWFHLFTFGLLTAIAYEQLSYMVKGKSLPGPAWTVPFLGGIIAMVKAPTVFWHGQMDLASASPPGLSSGEKGEVSGGLGLSWNAIVGQYFVMVTEASMVKKVFKNVSARMPLMLHPNAKLLLGADNIAFLNGDEHRHLKHSLLPLFTQNALSVYLATQETHIRDIIVQWIQISKLEGDMKMQPLVYDLNTNTSMSVFVGPYLSADMRKRFQQDYTALTQGILGFPLYVPGTKVWNGKRAMERIIKNLTVIAGEAKRNVSSGAPAKCLLDFWMQTLIPIINEAQRNQTAPPAHSSDLEIAKVLLDFLFASQDASTSSLTYTVHFLCKYPDVLAKIRAEQALVRPDRSAPITPDTLSKMTYTRQVMREILRFRPPATIVPHYSKDSFELNDKYTAPAGTLIVPSIWSCNRQGFSNPDTFDPDRFGPERDEERKFGDNFMTFGTGPHSCMGQRYAMNHIMLFMALLTTECEFTRKHTDKMDDIMYLPTIYPADGCVLSSLRSKG